MPQTCSARSISEIAKITNMSKISKKLLSDGIVLAKKALSIAEKVLLELVEQYEDMEYMRTHSYSVLGRDVRSARYENEAGQRLHEIKMRRQAIKRLAEQKYIRLRREGDKVIYELTQNGKVRVIKTAMIYCDDYFLDKRICLYLLISPKRPEDARMAFRRFLKSVGFKFVQGSVWSIKKNIVGEMEAIIVQLKIRRWVEVYEARSISREYCLVLVFKSVRPEQI